MVVVEDEPAIADAVVQRLRSEGFDARSVGDGAEAVELCARVKPDLVVLDLMLPGLDGLEVCRQIQAHRRVPVVMLTARDEETDLVVGLSVGADDYVTKPFSPRELVARIRAVLRRVEGAADRGASSREGAIEVDPTARRVRAGEESVHLTPLEFDLLAHLTGPAGRGLPARAAAGRRLGLRRRGRAPDRGLPRARPAAQARGGRRPHGPRRRLRPGGRSS